ncbi:MAG: NAD(P)H-dependent oxidoreductase [Balneolaceae bacterium]|nr:NAD(P)H-dependent oxidoreductase [Balneolaceae bacterium]
MKVTILLGSVREGRESHRPAHYVALKLKEKEIETDLIDLAADPLPIMGHEAGYDKQAKDRIEQISKRLNKSDAIIFVTPEYQASFSGVIKNAIDHFYSEFHKKAIGVVATSAGGMAGINASSQLQNVILGIGAFPMPMKLLVPHVQNAFDDLLEPHNEKIANMTEQFLDEFIWFSDALVKKKNAMNKGEHAA